MPDLQTYETTQLDWNAIKSLAVRAAKETPLQPAPALGYVKRNGHEFVDVCGPHWLLDNRYEWWEENRDYIVEESRSEDLYVLMPDGQLLNIFISEGFMGHREGHWRNLDDRHTVRPMTEDDVLSFDFARAYYERGDKDTPQGHIWGNCDRPYRRGALLQTRKGAGLSLLLENIRTGRAKHADGLIPDQERTQLLPGLTKFHHTPDKRAKVIADLRSARDKAAADQAAAAHAARQQALTRKIRNALSTARGRALIATGVWLFLSFVILGNNFMSEPAKGTYGFADSSYSTVAWTLAFAVAGGLVIDLAIGTGKTGAFVAGAVLGFAISIYTTYSKPYVGEYYPVELSLFWLTALFGLIAYLLSSLVVRSRGPRLVSSVTGNRRKRIK